jgi:diguanylate cyclase (GGDEF)-like protein/PAS domain S-box-containing protein
MRAQIVDRQLSQPPGDTWLQPEPVSLDVHMPSDEVGTPLQRMIADIRATPHLHLPLLTVALSILALLLVALLMGAGVIFWSTLFLAYSATGWLWISRDAAIALPALSWRVYLLAGVGAIALYPRLPSLAQDALYIVVGVAAVAALLCGWRLHASPQHRLWQLVATGIGTMVVTDLLWALTERISGRAIPFPSILDGGYLVGVVLTTIALSIIVHRHAPPLDRGAQIDAGIIAIGSGILAWVFLMEPYLHTVGGGRFERLAVISFLVIDLAIITVVLRMLLTPGITTRSYYAIVAGLVFLLVGDIGYLALGLNDAYQSGGLLDTAWLLSYLALGIAALHPSMAELPTPIRTRRSGLSGSRVVLLAIASLLAPGALAVQSLRGEALSAPIIAGSSAALFLLVILRMNGLIQVHLRALSRERTLRGTAATLVAATERNVMFRAACDTAVALTAGQALVAVTPRTSQHVDTFPVVASSAAEPPRDVRLLDLPKPARIDLIQLQSTHIAASDVPTVRHLLGWNESVRAIFITPIAVMNEVAGLIVSGANTMPDEIATGLESLAVQVALALESHHLTEQLSERRSEDRFRSLVRHSSDIITIVAPDGTIRYISPSVGRVLDHDPDALAGTDLRALVHADDHEITNAFITNLLRHPNATFSAGYRMQHRSGAWNHVEAVGTNLLDDDTIGGIVVNARDVTERKQAEEALAHRAFHDTLTGLPNRALFLDRVAHAIARGARRKESVAVLFLDLDRFKHVNDTLGHDAGDELLVGAAARIQLCLRQGDTGARLGGDEFTVLLEDMSSADDAIRVAERLTEQFKRPFTVAGQELTISTSIGIALSTNSHANPSDLLREADMAMYQAKARGKGCYAVYDAQMGADIVERVELETRLRRAIEQQEFRVYYQPQMELATGRVVSFEALVRWEPEDEPPISPDVFIPLAEDTGLIVPLGRLVLQQACQQARQWQQEYPESPPRIGVNLSARQFKHPDLLSDISAALHASDIDAGNLLLEITESGLMEAGDASITTLRSLKTLGVKLAIDDFGVGFSNLSALRHFPVDVLKIDRSFINRIGKNPEDTAIILAVTTLAHTLGMRVTAEGIETANQFAQLRDLGCDHGQGYLFARPLDSDAATEMLSKTAVR